MTLGIIGAGDLGQQIAYLALKLDCQFKEVVFFDDTKIGQVLTFGKVIGGLNDIEQKFQEGVFQQVIIGIGYNHMQFRKSIFEKFVGIIPFANVIHPSALIDESVKLGEGIVVYAGSIIDAQSIIQNNVLLNVGVTIAHDTIVGNHCFFGPRVAVAGFVKIDECCIFGINSTIIDNLTIEKNIRIGAGAVVTKHLIQSGTYVGVPANYLKK